MTISPTARYVSDFHFNPTGPLIVPIAADRGSAPLTFSLKVPAQMAFEQAFPGEAVDFIGTRKSIPDRQVILWRDGIPPYKGIEAAFLSAGGTVSAEQVSLADKNQSSYAAGFPLRPLRAMLAGAAFLSKDDAALSDVEFVKALAAHLYWETLPLDRQADRLKALNGGQAVDLAAQLPTPHFADPSQVAVLGNNYFLTVDRKLTATDEEVFDVVNQHHRMAIPQIEVTYNPEWESHEGARLRIFLKMDHNLRDVPRGFSWLFGLAAQLTMSPTPKDELRLPPANTFFKLTQ